MSVHANSVQAFHEEEAKLSRRATAVLGWIRIYGPHTDRQIAQGMGFGADMNAVRPRVTELIQAGLLEELRDVRCPVTGKTVRIVGLPRGQVPLFSAIELPAAQSDYRSMLPPPSTPGESDRRNP